MTFFCSKLTIIGNIRKELDAWLCASFTNATYVDSIQKRLPDTCDWILNRDEFRIWESPNFTLGRAKVLWINGPPGYGKTVLSARVVQHLKARDRFILASFFFSADLKDRADPFVVIRSWISQVISQSQDAFDLAYEKFEIHRGQLTSSSEVAELFKQIVHRVPNCTFIVDGLDECSSKGSWSTMHSKIKTLTSFIRMTTQAISSTNSRMLVVSREDQDIRNGFFEDSSNSLGIELLEYKVTPVDVKSDATKLSHNIVDQKLNNKSITMRAEIADRIVDRCDSMFLRIRLLEDDIRGGKNQRQLERIVDQAPTELSNLYDRNWARIMERGNDRARAVAILRWVVFGLRPITILEMTGALLLTDLEDIDELENELPDEVDEHYVKTEILELCASLVETRAAASTDDLGSRTLHLTHFTVKQYVLLKLPVPASQLIANSSLGISNELVQNNILAEASLRYIGISGIWDSAQHGKAIDNIGRSFRDYAADYWYKHAKREGPNYAAVRKLMFSFFCTTNTNWEAWRRHYDAIQHQSGVLQYLGEIKSASRLFYASLLGLRDVVEELIKHVGVDVDSVDEFGRTALLAAAHNGRHDVLQYLLDMNADVNKSSNEGRTLHVASNDDRVNIGILFQKDADWMTVNNSGWTALNAASYNNHVDVVKLLLKKGADWTITKKYGCTPLYAASYNGHDKVVRLLLEKGADWTTPNNDGRVPIDAALISGHVEVVKLLLEKGADWKIVYTWGYTPLYTASLDGHVEVVKLLLEKGADPTTASRDGWTPLHGAAYCGHLEVVEILCQNTPINVSQQDNNGRTALFLAAMMGRFDVLQFLLLNSPTDVYIKDRYDATPLFAASRHGHEKVTKTLLSFDHTTLDSTDAFGRTIQIWAKRSGNSRLMDLIDHYANPASKLDDAGDENIHSKPATSTDSSRWCDICTLPILDDCDHYNCAICNGGDYHICLECFEFDLQCQDESHEWSLVRGQHEAV